MDQGPGGLFGRFRLEERLGAGGLAEVWRAVDTETGQTVALKRFIGAIASSAAERLRADVELVAIHALRGHPNVVQVFGGGAEPAPHVVMEYVPGGDLGHELQQQGSGLSLGRTLEVGAAVSSALAAAAEAGVVHGDLKPSNILLGPAGVVKLADFNVARVIGYQGASVSGGLMLSFAYAAPEVWDGSQTPASDVYALGCVLYQCLTGRPPFRGANAEMFRAHLDTPPDLGPLPAEAPAELRELIGQMLAKDPGTRPSARSVTQQLERLRSGKPTTPSGAEESVPVAFGPWTVLDQRRHGPWAWRAQHRDTGEPATIELYFGDVALGDQVRRAVTVNERLVPLGAERLMDTNRLLLRPGESLGPSTPPGWVFWVARDELVVPPPARPLGRQALASAITALRNLLAAAGSVRLGLDLSGDNLALRADGSIHVRRPGLPSAGMPSDPSAAAVAALAAVAEPELRPALERSQSLDEAAAALGVVGFSNAADAAALDAPTVLIPSAPAAILPATPAVPAPTVAHAGQFRTPAPEAAPASPPRTPPPPRYPRQDRDSGGGKGLVAALAGIGLLLLGLIAFVAFNALSSPKATPTPTLVGGATFRPTPTSLPTLQPTLPTPTLLPTAALTPFPTFVPTPLVTVAPPTAPPPTLPPVQPTNPPPNPTNPPPNPTNPPPNPTNPPPNPTNPPPQNWQANISASDSRVQNGERVSIQATSNQNVGPSPWYLQVFNPDTGFIHWSCKTGTTCGGGARRENVTTTYQARISALDGSNVQAQSERITVTWEPTAAAAAWSVAISSSDSSAANGERVSIQATSNQNVGASPWYLQLYNPDTGFIHWSCKTGTTCGGGARRENITTAYQARISAVDGSNVQAQSERITVTWG